MACDQGALAASLSTRTLGDPNTCRLLSLPPPLIIHHACALADCVGADRCFIASGGALFLSNTTGCDHTRIADATGGPLLMPETGNGTVKIWAGVSDKKSTVYLTPYFILHPSECVCVCFAGPIGAEKGSDRWTDTPLWHWPYIPPCRRT